MIPEIKFNTSLIYYKMSYIFNMLLQLQQFPLKNIFLWTCIVICTSTKKLSFIILTSRVTIGLFLFKPLTTMQKKLVNEYILVEKLVSFQSTVVSDWTSVWVWNQNYDWGRGPTPRDRGGWVLSEPNWLTDSRRVVATNRNALQLPRSSFRSQSGCPSCCTTHIHISTAILMTQGTENPRAYRYF